MPRRRREGKEDDLFGCERMAGDNIECPRCGSHNTIRLISLHHCNVCKQSFTAYEVELKARVQFLERKVRQLERKIKSETLASDNHLVTGSRKSGTGC